MKKWIAKFALVITIQTIAASLKTSLPPFRKNIVVLDFYANWCETCHTNASWIKKLYRRYQHYQWIGVSQDETPKDALRFVQKHKLPYPQVFDRNHKIAEKYKIKAMPAFLVLNRRGKVLAEVFGTSHQAKKKLEAILQKYRRR
ncbi:MAG: TlpA family protein disulfide reductase [Candidatus Hydrogenedentota bacterium]|nr:MAG: TlpA family protein disulfide reductase [Candidatus Hydrogenedentota bacterium]